MTAAERKEIASLASPKGRKALGCFMAEGVRCVGELLKELSPKRIYCTADLVEQYGSVAEAVTRADIERISAQQTPQPVVGVFAIPAEAEFVPREGEICLALDAVQDPGNLGTIIRLADWFGVSQLLLGAGCADPWQPKVVQATMGALGRVKVSRTPNLAATLEASPLPVYGTFLDGQNLYQTHIQPSQGAIIVMGNEGNGISAAVEAVCTKRLLIPGADHVESLNVAMAAAITVSEFFRLKNYGQK